ncbi:hypothetical protein [Cytobacillus firmus]|uniref:hypothetical protein n=1 Tax=Cytobacillus firmus TaxID=1399 RepID=UPI0022284E5B|nr:hypothetical protein [Cytobacillus firmus]
MGKMIFEESMGMWVEDLSLGETLNWQRQIDGLTLLEFEKITGITYSLTSRYERNLKKISSKHEEIIIDYLTGGFTEQVNKLKNKKG